MRERLKAVYYLLLEGFGSDLRRLKRITRENLTVILNLHQISPHENPFWPPLHPKIFDRLLRFLKANLNIVLFDELSGSNRGKPRAILSFDDGYYNFVEYALPILGKHGVRANVNIIPACVESGEPIWNVQLYDFLRTAPKTLVDEIALPGFEIKLTDDSYYAKLRYGLGISRFLKNRSRRERHELLQGLNRIMDRHEFERTRMMNRQDVLQIAKTHDVGAHSYSHESMEFEETTFFEDDLRMCSAYFRERLKLPLETYAFPNGSFRPEQVAILKENGIRNVLVVGEDYYRPNDPVLSRFTIYGSSIAEAKYRALGINKRI
jgi:peptidoglycan/xylan/chitin deacetylase (PgdA/CDA1 family)